MLRFLAYYLAGRGETRATCDRLVSGLKAAAAREPRESVNRRYHRLFAGESVRRIAATGRAWWESENADGRALVPAVLEELKAHRNSGGRIVLVSGHLAGCLEPIAAAVGADQVICTGSLIEGGRLTGEVAHPVAGATKAAAVRREAEDRGLDPAACHAYSDHVSDLPMLQAVGNPVVVGDDPILTVHAALHGWRMISSHSRIGELDIAA